MTLRVTTSALRAFHTELQAWSDDTSAATAYVASHLDIGDWDAAMFHNISVVNDGVRTALDTALARIRLVTHESGLELGAAATMYDRTDQGQAQTYDNTYEVVARPPAGSRYDDIKQPYEDTVPKPQDPADATPGVGSGNVGGGGGSW